MIRLNIGGFKHCTSLSTLSSKGENFFTKMISNHESNTIKSILDETGAYFVDRNGELFGEILDYLRNGEFSMGLTSIQRNKLLKELDFYGIPLPKDMMNLADDNRARVLIIMNVDNSSTEHAILNTSIYSIPQIDKELDKWLQGNKLEKRFGTYYPTGIIEFYVNFGQLLDYLLKKGWNIVSINGDNIYTYTLTEN